MLSTIALGARAVAVRQLVRPAATAAVHASFVSFIHSFSHFSPFLLRVTQLATAHSAAGTVYGGKHTVTLLPGDGIGRELTNAVRTVFSEASVPITWEEVEVVADPVTGAANLNDILLSLRRNKVGLKGIYFTSIEKGATKSLNVRVRKELDLFASVVVCKSIPGITTRHNNVDLVVVRENIEGEYSGLEHEVPKKAGSKGGK